MALLTDDNAIYIFLVSSSLWNLKIFKQNLAPFICFINDVHKLLVDNKITFDVIYTICDSDCIIFIKGAHFTWSYIMLIF